MAQLTTKTNKSKSRGGLLAGLIVLAAGPAPFPVRAAASDVPDPEIEQAFKEGMAALEDERLQTAIEAFQKILALNPRLHRARLELALAYYRSLRYEEAERLAQEVLGSPATPPEVRVTILAFLAQVKRDSQAYGQKHSFKPFVSAGVMHDTNANVGPADDLVRVGDVDLVLVPGSTERSDNAYVVSAGLDHLYQSGRRVQLGERTGMLVWQSGANVYSRRYNRYSEYDLLIGSINTGPAVLMLRHWRASLQFRSDYLKLGGHALGWFNTLNPSITWQFDNGEASWDAEYTRRFYHRDIDEAREGDYLATGVRLGRYFNRRRGVVTGGAKVMKFFAESDEFGYLAGQLSAGLTVDTWSNGSFYARGSVAYYQYDGNDSLFDKARNDKEYRITAGLVHEYKNDDDLLKHWTLALYWERIFNDSNIGDLYSYNRHQTMISLSRNF